MWPIKGVMLLPLDSENYRRHMARQAFISRVNAAETTPDFRLTLTRAVEQRVRDELCDRLSATRYRVLRWEEADRASRYVTRYRELDGVYRTPSGTTALLEVKASASKGSLKSGLRQLRASVKTHALVQPRTLGILVIADLGALVEGFGSQDSESVRECMSREGVAVLDWPIRIPDAANQGIFMSTIPASMTANWLASDHSCSWKATRQGDT